MRESSTSTKPATLSVQVRYSSARSLKKFMDGKSIFHGNNTDIPRTVKFYTIQEAITLLKSGGKMDGVSCRFVGWRHELDYSELRETSDFSQELYAMPCDKIVYS